MSTGGSGPPVVSKLGLDISNFESQIDRAVASLTKYSKGVREATFSTTEFNSKGQLIGGVLKVISDQGIQIEQAYKRLGKTWSKALDSATKKPLAPTVRDTTIGEKLATKRAEDAANKEAAVLKRRTAQVAKFRAQAARWQQPTIGKNPNPQALLPAGVTPVRTRLFQGALQDLEDFVRQGRISGQRAIAIVDDVNKGVNRRLKNPQHEEYRLTAMRLITASRNVRAEVEKEQQRTANRAASVNVAPALQAQLGNLPTTALAGATSRMEGYYNKIAKSVESATATTGVQLGRFNQLLTQFAAGTVAPTNDAERQVVKTMRRITAELQRETERQAKLAAKAQAQRDSTIVGPSIRATLGAVPATASTGTQTRVTGYYDKIAKSVETATATTGVQLGRFNQLLTQFAAGTATPINAAERQLVGGLRRITSEMQKEVDRQAKIAAKAQAQRDSTIVGSNIKATLGALPATAPAGAQTRVTGYYDKIAQSVETATATTGVQLGRFNQLLAQFAAGTVSPINKAERQLVGGLRRITAELQREVERQARIAAKAQAQRDSTIVGPSIRTTLGALPATAPAGAQTRVTGYYDKIAQSVETATATTGVQLGRFNQLLADFAAGTAAPINKAERQLIGGLHRITNEMQKEVERQVKITQRANAQTNSQLVTPTLQAQFGQLQPGATPAAASRLEGYYNRIARAIESSTNTAGVQLPRFQQLVAQFAAGVVAPVNNAERQVVKGLGNIAAEMEKDQARVQQIAAQAARNVGATNAGQSLYNRIGAGNISRLGEQDQERVQQQVARIQRLVSRQNNPLSSSGFTTATNAGFTNTGKGSFQGVEEEARRSAARIRAIITGQLATPFQVHLQAAQRDFQTLRNGLTVLFAGNAIRQVSEGFEQLVSAAAEYQRSIALIQTITQETSVTFDQWSSNIEKVSNNLGKPIEEVAKATYDLLSNQVTSGLSDSMQVMNTAAQFARTTNSGIEDSVNLLSSAINTFKLSAGDAERVAASFFTTIDLGRVRTGEMSNTIGRSAVYAQTLGVTLQELEAGIITITQTGQKADSSFTLLNNVFQKLLNPTKELQAYYDELGVGTGELFVKTYGFTGALQKLQEATKGSTAKLSDFFNEIRAFGGIDALISRSKQFKNALDELGNSASKAEKAKHKFDELPGQRFLQEMTKLRNFFLTGFQTNVLKGVLWLTDGLGGLSNALINTGQVITIFGSTLAGAFTVNSIMKVIDAVWTTNGAMAKLTGTTVNYAAAANLAWGLAAVAILAVVYTIKRLIEAQAEYAAQVAEMSQEVAEKQKATISAKYSDLREAYSKDLNSERQALLARVADYVKLAKSRVDIEKKANDKVQENAKNAYENVLSSAKSSLEALKSKQQEALRWINEFRKNGPQQIRNNRDEGLFRYRMARNDSVNNGDVRVEKRLYQSRIKQLNNLAREAAKRGDHAAAEKYLGEKDQLINEISTKTVQVNGQTYMKYTNVEAMLRQSALYRLNVEKQIDAVLSKRALDQQETITKQEEALKDLEDAYKDVYDTDLEKKGKPVFKNKEEFYAEYDKRVAVASKKTKDFQANFGGADPTMSRNLTNRQFDIATGRNAAYRESASRKFEADSRLKQGEDTQAETNKSYDEAKERHKLLTAKAEEVDKKIVDQKQIFTNNFLPHANQKPIPGEPIFGQVNPESGLDQYYYRNEPGVLKKAQLVGDIQAAQKAENYDLAEKKILELMGLYKQLGLLQKQIVGAGGENTTIEANLNAARVAVRQLAALQEEQRGYQQSLKAPATAQTYTANALHELEAEFGRVGDASNAITIRIAADFEAQGRMADTLAAKLQKVWELQRLIGPTQDEQDSADYDRKTHYSEKAHSMGGPIGYYSHGGGPKGTDVVPAWLTPGEFVVNSKQAPKYQSILKAMNAGYYASGGSVDAGLYGGGIFGHIASHNADWVKKQHERSEKIMRFNEVMAALREQGTDGATLSQYAMNFYNPEHATKQEKLQQIAASKKNKGSGVWNLQSVSDESDFEYHAVGGWVGKAPMPGRIQAMNSGFGQKSETHTNSSVNVGDINVTIQGGNSGRQTAEVIGRELNRAIRRKSIDLRGN